MDFVMLNMKDKKKKTKLFIHSCIKTSQLISKSKLQLLWIFYTIFAGALIWDKSCTAIEHNQKVNQ